ncbi:MAG: AAA family ATPase, partial [Chloroflexota bacterium]|nr:AAA family ATPase [Chloroflexota bacterium]
IEEFVTIERHVELAAWKRARLAAPERRLLAGQSLVVRYLESDQDPATVAKNQDNERRRVLKDEYRAAFRAANPEATQIKLPKEQLEESSWSQEGMRFRLRLETASTDCDLDEAIALSTLRPADWLVLFPRLSVDSRLPTTEQVPYTPTAKQLLYGMRAELDRITVERHQDRAVAAWAEIVMKQSYGNKAMGAFGFGTIEQKPLEAGTRYTLDPDPNDIYGYWAAKIAEGLVGGGENTLYALLTGESQTSPHWPEAAVEGQTRFLAGLDALHAAGAFHDFEPSKRKFIADHGATPLLLVQGPPGTGKSYSTAFALLARFQGALAANLDFRVFLSCKTHAATDVLMENLLEARASLGKLSTSQPEIFAAHFDRRLLELLLFRNRPRGDLPAGIIALPKDRERQTGAPKAIESILAARWCAVATTPGGAYGLLHDRWPKELFDHRFVDCLVLDEASQMNLPEAIMAALPLKADGRLVVVGDHRQMPPIVKHDWATESRRTFQEFRSYESLFLALLPLKPPMIKFEESFRLHADMAEFLRREIYAQDGINFHSNKRGLLDSRPIADDFVAAVLAPEHPLVVVVHDEAASQLSNRFEQDLLAPILAFLADPASYNLDPTEGLGVVVPHRAQRAALQERVPALTRIDPNTGAIMDSAVDTVERFQGGERIVILVGATES